VTIFRFAMRDNPQKTTQIGIRLDPDTRKRLEAAADREKRSISDFVRLLILRAVKRSRAA
jgi:uncharacterized protein (DUF1778 family)